MFDIGWSEMAIIMLVALVVIGPRDLPRLARSVGQWVAKGRAMAREFQRSLEEMAREAELDDVKREIEKVGRTDIGKAIEKTIDPSGDLGKAFKPLSATDNKALAKSAGASAANGEAKAIAKPEPAAQAPKAKPEAVAPAPEAAAPAKAATKPKATKPRATTAKADTAKADTARTATTKAAKPAGKAATTAKPKAAAKSAPPAKPRTSRAAPKTASSEAGEAEAIAEPVDARGA